jgi:hypothetical protein
MDTQKTENYEELKARLAELQQKLGEAEALETAKKLAAAPLTTLYSWEGPDRLYSSKSRIWYTLVSLAFIAGIGFAVVTQELLLVVVLLAVLGLVYLSSVVKPNIVGHEITNKGLKTAGRIYYWSKMRGFWFTSRGGQLMLMIDLEMQANPNRIIIPLGIGSPRKLLSLLMPHIPYLNRNDIGEDLINIFTLGTYQPITRWIADFAVSAGEDAFTSKERATTEVRTQASAVAVRDTVTAVSPVTAVNSAPIPTPAPANTPI